VKRIFHADPFPTLNTKQDAQKAGSLYPPTPSRQDARSFPSKAAAWEKPAGVANLTLPPQACQDRLFTLVGYVGDFSEASTPPGKGLVIVPGVGWVK
jgi:hypothetical protein